jgi:hypothetical protein
LRIRIRIRILVRFKDTKSGIFTWKIYLNYVIGPRNILTKVKKPFWRQETRFICKFGQFPCSRIRIQDSKMKTDPDPQHGFWPSWIGSTKWRGFYYKIVRIKWPYAWECTEYCIRHKGVRSPKFTWALCAQPQMYSAEISLPPPPPPEVGIDTDKSVEFPTTI